MRSQEWELKGGGGISNPVVTPEPQADAADRASLARGNIEAMNETGSDGSPKGVDNRVIDLTGAPEDKIEPSKATHLGTQGVVPKIEPEGEGEGDPGGIQNEDDSNSSNVPVGVPAPR